MTLRPRLATHRRFLQRRAIVALADRFAAPPVSPLAAPVPTAPGVCRVCGGPIARYPAFADLYTLDQLAADGACAACYVPF